MAELKIEKIQEKEKSKFYHSVALERVFILQTIVLHRHILMDRLIHATVIVNRQRSVKSVENGQQMRQHQHTINVM